MILISVLTISVYCFGMISEREFIRPPGGYFSINKDRYWDMLGFSFYMFEGIGAVMPVMSACNSDAKRHFPYLIAAALSTLCTIYILFSEICYYCFGNNLNESIVMQEMPSDDLVIQVVKVLYCFNIVFSYPITIYPTNVILDTILFDQIFNIDEGSKKRYYFENLLRVVVLIIGIVLAVFFYDQLDKIMALGGTILGTTVVLFTPAACHYKIVQSSPKIDIFITIYALIVLVFCSGVIFAKWSN